MRSTFAFFTASFKSVKDEAFCYSSQFDRLLVTIIANVKNAWRQLVLFYDKHQQNE
jgi:hypothetical protein